MRPTLSYLNLQCSPKVVIITSPSHLTSYSYKTSHIQDK